MLLCVLLPLQGLAQVSPPPLISAPSATEEAPPDSQATPSGEEDAPQGELIPHSWTPQGRRAGGGRLPLQAVAGSLLGVAGAIPGVLLMNDSFICEEECTGPVSFYAALGISAAGLTLGATLGIAGVGYVMEDEGHLLATLGGVALGTLAGMGVGLLVAFVAWPLVPVPLLAGPVLGGILGYQKGYTASRAPGWSSSASGVWLPVVGVSPSGGIIAGVAGGF
jgi:hypothetical protein